VDIDVKQFLLLLQASKLLEEAVQKYPEFAKVTKQALN
jgi:hypothetical protein